MSNETTSVPDSWESRIEQFAKIVGLSIEEVETAFAAKPFELKKDTPYVMEMFSDETIIPFGDLRNMFCEKRDVSMPKLRLGLKYLRGPKEKREVATTTIDPDMMDLQTKYGIKTRFDDLGAEELIPNYNPTKQNRITKALQKMFNDKPVIAFKPDSKTIAVEETVNYISDLNDGLPEEDAIEVDGELVRLYAIGKIPHETIEEDPLFAGHPLKRGRSILNRFDWSDFNKSERQFVRLLVDEGAIDPEDRMQIRAIMSDIRSEGTKSLKGVFPEVYMLFKELMKTEELPKLQMSLEEATTTRTNNPFGIGSSHRSY